MLPKKQFTTFQGEKIIEALHICQPIAFFPCLGRLPNMLMTLSPQVMVYFSMLGLGDHGMGQPKACMTLGFHDRWP